MPGTQVTESTSAFRICYVKAQPRSQSGSASGRSEAEPVAARTAPDFENTTQTNFWRPGCEKEAKFAALSLGMGLGEGAILSDLQEDKSGLRGGTSLANCFCLFPG